MNMRLYLSIILFMAVAHAGAFESWEHRRMSDLAYHVAIQIHCPDNASDELCSDLRPESKVDVSASGKLWAWCRENSKEPACEKLQYLYRPSPTAEYEASELAKICAKNPDKEAACGEMATIIGDPHPAWPVSYAQKKGILKWCNKNRDDQPFCEEIRKRISATLDNMRGIIRACLRSDRRSNCEFQTDPLEPNERLARASFFDPLEPGKKDVTHLDDSDLSYGQVTKCVDYFLTPDKMMAGGETVLWSKTEEAQLEARNRVLARKLYPTRREDLDLSVSKRCKDSDWNLEGARSGHVNHTHFQAELLLAQNSNHLLALTLHAVEKNRFAALTANAISDHYLQDSMAPGHITTWRSRLTDLAANAFHDKRNREGLYVRVDKQRFDKMMKRPGDEITLDALFEQLASTDTDGVSAALIREYFLTPDLDHYNHKFDRSFAEKRDYRVEIRLIRKLVGDLNEKLQSKNPHAKQERCRDALTKCVYLRGDGALWHISQDEQRLLMLLLQVRSILDVLESAPTDQDADNRFTLKNSFKETSWSWNATEEAPRILPFVNVTYPPETKLMAGVGPVEYDITQSNSHDASFDHSYRSYDPVFGINLGMENMTFGEQQNRKTVALEAVFAGVANEKRDSFNVAGVIGVQKFFEPASNGYGVSLRGSFVLPQIETIFSVPIRMIRIGIAESDRKWRPTIGMRIDQGFTSFATFFLQVTKDYAAQRNGKIESGISVGAGIQIAGPRCRIPLIKTVNCD